MTVSVKQLLKSKKKTSLTLLNQQRNLVLGQRGEQLATQFLLSRQYHILARNVRVGRGEIDIIALDSLTREIVFVEVKTRSQVFSGDPGLAANSSSSWRKWRAMYHAALEWMTKVWRKGGELRIDVIAISPGKLRHYKNVSW